jgi:hypothetical protein
MSKVLTPARRARLEKLAAYLEGLPKRYKHFEMSDYMGLPSHDQRVVEYALKNGGVNKCETVACALGHGPAAGILVPRSMIFGRGKWRTVSWAKYGDLFTGDYYRSEEASRLFRWCFGGEWQDVDNHHWGAAARIRYLLAHGTAPAEYDEKALPKWRKLYRPYRIDAKAPAEAVADHVS